MDIASRSAQKKHKAKSTSKVKVPKNPPKVENPSQLRRDLELQLFVLNSKISEIRPDGWKCDGPAKTVIAAFGAQKASWATCPPVPKGNDRLKDLLDQREHLLGDIELLKSLTPEALKTRLVADPIEQFLRKQYALSLSPRTCALWARVIRYEAKRIGIDPKLVLAFIKQESGFKGDAVGPDGKDHGPMQLRDAQNSTMEEIKRITGLDWTKQMLKTDPIVNIRGGVRYLEALGREYDGNAKLTTLSYNGGYVGIDRVLERAGIATSVKKPSAKLKKISASKRLIDKLVQDKKFKNNDYLTSVYATYNQYRKTIPDWKKAPTPASFKVASHELDDSDEIEEAFA